MDTATRQQPHEAHPPARSTELLVDGQSFLIAHNHIHSVERIVDVRMETGHEPAMGTLRLGMDEWPVFCLDRDLNILGKLPAARHACVLLKSEYGGVGVLCDEARVLDNTTLTIVPIPGCMSDELSLTETLAIIDGKITCMLGAERLSVMLRSSVSDDGVQAPVLPAGMP